MPRSSSTRRRTPGAASPSRPAAAGIRRALDDGGARFGISSGLILCFLREPQRGGRTADTLEAARPFAHHLTAVGLDSAEVGNPPSKFATRLRAGPRDGPSGRGARRRGGSARVHLGGARHAAEARRIDHGVRCLEDERLVERLVAEQIPLTVCPFSNVQAPGLSLAPPTRRARPSCERGLLVTVNSDDPAYFGGYVADNLAAVAETFDLPRQSIAPAGPQLLPGRVPARPGQGRLHGRGRSLRL